MSSEVRDSNLYFQMEKKRESVANISKEDFIPTFIINELRETLEASVVGEDTCIKVFSKLKTRNVSAASHSTTMNCSDENQWTDNTLLEENLDFEDCYFLGDEIKPYVDSLLKYYVECLSLFPTDEERFLCLFVEEV